MDDHGVLDVQQNHGVGDEGDEAGLVDAHDLAAGSGGVEQGAEDVQDGAHAEGFADRHHCFQLRMMRGGEEEGEAVGAEGLGGFGGGEVDGDAEGFEDVGGAAEGGDGAVAVLGDFDSGCRCDQGGGGGDVEAAAGVASGAAGVDQVVLLYVAEGKEVGGVAEGVGEAGDLGGGFAAGGQGAEQGGEFDVAGLAGEDAFHERGGVFAGEGFALFEDAAKLVAGWA